MVFKGYTLAEINDHWQNNNVPGILHDLSERSFSLQELRKSLKSLEAMPQDKPYTEICLIRHALINAQSELDYSLYVLDKMCIMVS